MRILFLDTDIPNQEFYKNLLRPISENQELTFFTSSQDLIDHFENTLPSSQEHIDLLISEFNLPDRTFKEVLETVRNSQATYSNNNFKLSALPVLLHTNHDTTSDFEKLDVDLIIPKPKNENKIELTADILTLVKSWRMRIFDDLEILGIGLDYDFSKIGMGYSVRVKTEKTKILSSSFLIKQKALPYLWLGKDFFEAESSVAELEKLTTMYLDLPRDKLQRLDWEGQLQDFFNRNPKFLFQNNFSHYWSNPQINYPDSRNSIKPDLVAKPIVSPELGKNWHIVDLKLPIQEFLQKTNFHSTFTAKFFKCLKQIKDYKRFFMDDRNSENLIKKFNFHPKHPKLTLVLGRRNQLLEKQDILYENLIEFNASDVYLMTYDEILENRKRELERLMTMRLF